MPAELAALGAGEVLHIGDISILNDLQSGTQLGEALVNGDGIYQIQLSDAQAQPASLALSPLMRLPNRDNVNAPLVREST